MRLGGHGGNDPGFVQESITTRNWDVIPQTCVRSLNLWVFLKVIFYFPNGKPTTWRIYGIFVFLVSLSNSKLWVVARSLAETSRTFRLYDLRHLGSDWDRNHTGSSKGSQLVLQVSRVRFSTHKCHKPKFEDLFTMLSLGSWVSLHLFLISVSAQSEKRRSSHLSETSNWIKIGD